MFFSRGFEEVFGKGDSVNERKVLLVLEFFLVGVVFYLKNKLKFSFKYKRICNYIYM